MTRGDHVAAVTTLYGFKMIELAYRAKLDNVKKAKTKKANFLSFFSTYCVTTLTCIPEEKKRNYPDGTRAPSNFINCYNFLE